jgi:hypothetical protein
MSTTHNADTDYLIDYSADSSHAERLALVHCPICGERILDDLEPWPDHDAVVAHLCTHEPGDVGLDDD